MQYWKCDVNGWARAGENGEIVADVPAMEGFVDDEISKVVGRDETARDAER